MDELRKILSTLHIPRKTRGNNVEKPESAHRRAAVDRAMLLTMVQAGMGRAEAVRLVWGDVRKGRMAPGRCYCVHRGQAGEKSGFPSQVLVFGL